MKDFNPAHSRAVPVFGTTSVPAIEILPRDISWRDLGALLDATEPKVLGLLLPFSLQLHWYAYREARARKIGTALALPSNITALVGLMEEVPVEMIVATEAAAKAFFLDARKMGVDKCIKATAVLCEPGQSISFQAPHGITISTQFP